MHKEILSESQVSLLPLVSAFSRSFYLAGGTAVALHIGHRRSIDFDLFSNKEFDRLRIKTTIKNKGYTVDRIIHESSGQMHVMIRGVKLTFFQFPFRIDPEERFGKTNEHPRCRATRYQSGKIFLESSQATGN